MSETALSPIRLPFGSLGKKSTGWWGMLCLVATEACLFAYLLFSYAFTAIQMGPSWQPGAPPSLKLALPNTILLLASSVAVWWGERGIKHGRRGQLLLGVGVAIVLGAIFVAVQLKEWSNKPFRISTSGYASHYFTITGFHLAHVALGLTGLLAVFIWGALGYFDRQRNTAVLVTSIYWHFVDAVWLCVFTTFYIAPYLMTP
ncbi:MAG: heme-copper oxidase subunit III [Caulobacterales bacterium]|jgi:heme/copper-type cytochrome/quinol oxidase subunit 3